MPRVFVDLKTSLCHNGKLGNLLYLKTIKSDSMMAIVNREYLTILWNDLYEGAKSVSKLLHKLGSLVLNIVSFTCVPSVERTYRLDADNAAE